MFNKVFSQQQCKELALLFFKITNTAASTCVNLVKFSKRTTENTIINEAKNILHLIIDFFNIVDMKKDDLFIYSIS